MYLRKQFLIIVVILLLLNTTTLFAENSEIADVKELAKEAISKDTILFYDNVYIETVRHEGTSSLLDVLVYEQIENNKKVLFEKNSIYKGNIEIKDDIFIVKAPVYSKGDPNALPSSYKIDEYIYDGKNIYISNSELKFNSMSLSDKMSKTEAGEWTEQEIEILQIIEEVALDKCIPPAILKSIAYTESRLKQFDYNGDPLKPYGEESYGIMQVNLASATGYDTQNIKYDIRYNIEVGADILLSKWYYAYAINPVTPKIGDGDTKILENWYFAIWAYNGYSYINNPNLLPNEDREIAYQDQVIEYASEKFNQDITKVPKTLLPQEGIPETTEHYSTPIPIHRVEFNSYSVNDILIHVEQNDDNLSLRDKENNWSKIASIAPYEVLKVLDSNPVLYNGLYRYKVQTLSNTNPQTGWVAANWLKKMRKTDINNDGITNIFDIVKIARKINTVINNESNYLELDLNYDGIINLNDLSLLSYVYGKKNI